MDNNLTQEKVIDILRKIIPYLRKTYNVTRIGLFGSFAKGTFNKSSDIDILIEFEEPPGLKFMELAEYIENQTAGKTDIITPEGIKSIRIKKIADDILKSVVYV